ncbi:MAG: DUF58 domain-containing protein [Clostridia bacterium]|nr:DUF58 domain-containing protein [Clostridia bacterium]
MDNNDNGGAVKIQKGAILYAIALVASFISTQALRNPISGILFLFLFFLPIISIVCAILGRSLVQVYVSSDKARCEKDAPVNYEIRIINTSPIPYPFVEAFITHPRDDGIRCLKKRMYLSLAPFDGYIIKKEVSFRYRGLYEIGVSHLYISDFLRLVRLRVDIDNYSNIIVYPRILDVAAEERHAYTELPSVHAPTATAEMAEAANIREYRMGDSQKSVHWKLSSKTEELQVRDYSINRDRNVYIFADLAEATPCPEKKKVKAPEKQMKKMLARKEKKKIRLSDAAVATAKSKADKLSKKFGKKSIFDLFKKKEKKQRRDIKGVDEKTMDTVRMIDNLIDETAFAQARRRKENKLKMKNAKNAEKLQKQAEYLERLNAEEEAEQAIIDKLYSDINEVISDEDYRVDDTVMAWGGKVKDEYTDDMAEYCADGIVEIALSAVKRELNMGNRCTLVWYDRRASKGYTACTIATPAELEDAFNRFSAAATVPCDKRITDLIRIVDESMNVTVKYVTSNIDPYSLSEYCLIPAMFGGAGTGCNCEVMVFNPESRYTDPLARKEYAASCKDRFISSGIYMTEFKYINIADNKSTLVSVDY